MLTNFTADSLINYKVHKFKNFPPQCVSLCYCVSVCATVCQSVLLCVSLCYCVSVCATVCQTVLQCVRLCYCVSVSQILVLLEKTAQIVLSQIAQNLQCIMSWKESDSIIQQHVKYDTLVGI